MATADDIFNAIKAHELDFPIPNNSATIVIGQFNAHDGTFSGLTTETEVVNVGGKPKRIVTPPATSIDAVNAVLRFTSTAPGVTVVAGGHSAHSQGTTVDVDVGPASSVDWKISVGVRSYHDTLQIDRPPQIGIGAFVVPVLPIGLVYEPPPDQSKKNQALYSSTQSVSTQIKLSFTNGTTSSNDGDFLTFANATALLKSISDTLSAFQKANNPATTGGALTWVAAAAAAASLISSLIGSTTNSNSLDDQVTANRSLTVKTTTADTISTGAANDVNAGGPGVGDQFYVLRNAKLMWVVRDRQLHLTLLGFDREATIGVAPLKAGGAAIGLDAATAGALLALDPFVAGGPTVVPPSNRFVLVKTCEIDQAPGRHDFSLTTSSETDNSTADVTTSVKTTQEREGWLGFLGIGPGANTTTKTTISNSRTVETVSNNTQVGTVSLFSTATEPSYAVEIYQDAVFGSFAFRLAPPLTATARVAGTTVDATGKPRGRVEVTLLSGGRTYETLSDASGNFQFRSPGIAPGMIEIRSGRGTVSRSLTGTAAVTGVKLPIE
jgi:hypothetical protein